MIKRDVTQLAIYQTQEELETIPLADLHNLYIEKTSEIIYITKRKKLYGIVCLEDVLNHTNNGVVRINKIYTVLSPGNIIKSHEIFQRKKRIHKIPIVDEYGELLGDYSRWDDLLFIERNQEWIMREEDVAKRFFDLYETVYIVEPVISKRRLYEQLRVCLEAFSISFQYLSKEMIKDKMSEKAICIFLDEDEKRGIQSLYGVRQKEYNSRGYDIRRYDISEDMQWKIRLTTYRNLLMQFMEDAQLKSLGIVKPERRFFQGVNVKASVLLSALEKRGVRCFGISLYEDEMSEYGKVFQNEVAARIKKFPSNMREPWPKREENKDFYGDLYQFEDYKNEEAQKEFVSAINAFQYKRELSGKYCNARDGRRVTCFQPESYIGTIYIMGTCMTLGVYVEDQYTIASCLQKSLLLKGYHYKVENYGEMIRNDAGIDSRLMEIKHFSVNDIVIYQSVIGEIANIKTCSLDEIFEKNNIPSEWVKDGYGHCNHKVNELVSNSILEVISPCLHHNDEDYCNKKIEINVGDLMKDYVQCKYLKQLPIHFCYKEYKTVGSIVMKGDPFHKGHRYLIEQARKQVDFLIIFVLEEELTMFSFEERYKMIVKGVEDLDHIMVVPSGGFLLSFDLFSQFWTNAENDAVVLNSEYDAKVFADYIAEPGHITHRFTGKDPQKRVIKEYNMILKKILPQEKIEFIEIPSLFIESEIVSSSKIRSNLRYGEYDKVFTRVPETTKKYLLNQV